MIIIIGGLIVFFIVEIVKNLYFYCSNIETVRKHAIIKFKDFVKYYQINPNKWDLRRMRVGYTPKTVDDLSKDERNMMQQEYYSIWCNDYNRIQQQYLGKIFYRFSFIDSWRYKKWREDLNKRKKKEENRKEEIRINEQHKEDIISLLEGVQRDINKLCQQSENELNQAMNTMKEVKERIG